MQSARLTRTRSHASSSRSVALALTKTDRPGGVLSAGVQKEQCVWAAPARGVCECAPSRRRACDLFQGTPALALGFSSSQGEGAGTQAAVVALKRKLRFGCAIKQARLATLLLGGKGRDGGAGGPRAEPPVRLEVDAQPALHPLHFPVSWNELTCSMCSSLDFNPHRVLTTL